MVGMLSIGKQKALTSFYLRGLKHITLFLIYQFIACHTEVSVFTSKANIKMLLFIVMFLIFSGIVSYNK
jgi:hypothetical protein